MTLLSSPHQRSPFYLLHTHQSVTTTKLSHSHLWAGQSLLPVPLFPALSPGLLLYNPAPTETTLSVHTHKKYITYYRIACILRGYKCVWFSLMYRKHLHPCMLQKGCYSAKTFLIVNLRKFIPSKYTRYTRYIFYYTPCPEYKLEGGTSGVASLSQSVCSHKPTSMSRAIIQYRDKHHTYVIIFPDIDVTVFLLQVASHYFNVSCLTATFCQQLIRDCL